MLSITTFIAVLSTIIVMILLVYFTILKLINIKNKNYNECDHPLWKYYGYALYIAFISALISLILFVTIYS